MSATLKHGSWQYWPRKRVDKFLPSVNWGALIHSNPGKKGVLGFIVYKVGMKSAYIKDLTLDSLSKDKNITIPVSVLETPPMKIFSVRFYKNNTNVGEILNENIDKELKKVVKLPKTKKKWEEFKKEFNDIKIIAYSQAKKTDIKKTPDMTEIGLGGSLDDKKEFIRSHMDKEIMFSEFTGKNELVDVRGLTKGKGLSGPVKRFGVELRFHKSEKGQRGPGSLGPWHPARVTYHTPIGGQLGMFTRVHYNQKVVDLGKISEKNINPKSGFESYGEIKTDYVLVEGSVQGPCKRQLLVTMPLRKTKKQDKEKYNFIELR